MRRYALVGLLLGSMLSVYGIRPAVALAASSSQQAASLRLPDSAFSPATLNQPYVGTLDASTADSNSFFVGNHSTSYSKLGFISGYYERADWQPSGSSDSVAFRYQGSVFRDATTAVNAWTDGITYSQSSNSTQSYPCSYGSNCQVLGYANGGIDDLYLATQVNQCLLEVSAEGTDAVFSAQTTQIANTLKNIAAAAVDVAQTACGNAPPPAPTPRPTPQPTPTQPPVATPTPTPTPQPTTTTTDFSVTAVRLEKLHAKPDFDQVQPQLKQVLAGTPAQVSIYYAVTNAPSGAPITFHVTIRLGGRVFSRQDLTNHLLQNPVTTYVEYIRPLTLQKAGKYTVDVVVNSGGQAADGFTTFSVMPKVASAPPQTAPKTPPKTAPKKAPKKVLKASFSFTSLQAINGNSNHPQDSFRPGDRVGYAVNWTIKNLHGKARTWIIATYQNPTQSGWEPFGKPGIHIVTGTDGSNFYSDSFVLPTSFTYSSLRIVVGVTIGRASTQKRAVIIHVNH